MSSIEKLSIRGIRSFSPNREEIIEFYHPLTVILGDNGSGKTTIIECLKIACTGSLPPGARSGQSFIHDPRIAGTSEVKASVRLRFRNRAGKPMVVQRTFQLVQTKSKTQYKAMDGVIRVVNDLGEKVSMSHKCAELDRHIPEMLGVSKAILESVIFCHQEDSNWPLLEGAVLKKRFDDIFESARYTKALEAIRKLKKARGDDAKDHKRNLDILGVKLTAAEEIRRKIEVAQDKLQDVKEESARLDGNVDNAEESLEELEQLLHEIQSQHTMLERLESDETKKDASAQHAYNKLDKLMSGTDEQLETLLINYDDLVKKYQLACDNLQHRESQLQQQQNEAQDDYNKLCTEKGKVDAKIEGQQDLITELLELAAKTGTKYQFHTQPLSSQDDEIKSFLSKFQHHAGEKTKARTQLEAQNQRADDQLNASLTDLKSKLHHAKEQAKIKQKQLGVLNGEKRNNAARLKDLSSKAIPTARDVVEADRLIEEATKALQVFKEKHPATSLQAAMDEINKQIHDTNFEIDQIETKLTVLRAYEQDYLALDSKRKECRDKESDFEEKLADMAADYRRVFGGEAPTDEASLASAVQRMNEVLSARKQTLAEKKKLLAVADKKLQENLASSKHIEKSVAALRLEKNELERGPIGELRRSIEEISTDGDLRNAEEFLQAAEQAYFAAKDKTVRCTNTIKFLDIFKKKGVKEKCCPLCVRDLNPAEEELFIKTINEKTDDKKVKDKIKKAEASEEAALKKWKGMEANMPSWRKWMRMGDQIAAASNELDALYASQRAFQADVKDMNHQVEMANSQIEEVDEALRAFTSCSSLVEEIRRLRAKVTGEEERLRSTDADSPNREEVQKIRDAKQSELQDFNRQLQQKQTEQQRIQSALQQLQNDLFKKREEKMNIDARRKEYEATIEEQTKLRDQEKVLRDEIAELTHVEPQLEQDVSEKVKEVIAHRSDAAGRLHQMRQEEQECKQDLRSLQEKWSTVGAQAGQNLDRELKRLSEQIAHTKQKHTAAAQALEELSPDIESARGNLADQEMHKRQIRDNLEHRNLVREREILRAEVTNTKYKISRLPALDDVSRRVNGAKSVVGAARDERSTLRGRQQQLEEQIKEYKIQLRSSEYKNVDEKHRQTLIQYETTMMAVSDLDKYFKALDHSLLQYHGKKVEEINTIIKSLWQITYKGQDIDTIELVSGQELDTGHSVKASRSYDYRVVMKKGGALIDMRGRCSAGQKVLAAMVIRLALAETFCLNCGILALDEPTTNLDTENKLGLAQAMTDILNARASQQNFQLVCITHDEEFVQMLSEAQAMDGVRPEYYWRISREDVGNNRFCSKIERREWADGR